MKLYFEKDGEKIEVLPSHIYARRLGISPATLRAYRNKNNITYHEYIEFEGDYYYKTKNMKKIKFTITIKNKNEWPEADENGGSVGNYVEWSNPMIFNEDENKWENVELESEIEERIDKECAKIEKQGLSFYRTGESFDKEILINF